MIRGGKPNVPRRALSRIKTCKLAFVAAPCNMYIQNIDGIGDRSNPVRGQMKKASESKRASIGFRSGAHLPTFTYPPHSFAANFLCAPPISLAPTHIHTHTHTHIHRVLTHRVASGGDVSPAKENMHNPGQGMHRAYPHDPVLSPVFASLFPPFSHRCPTLRTGSSTIRTYLRVRAKFSNNKFYSKVKIFQ